MTTIYVTIIPLRIKESFHAVCVRKINGCCYSAHVFSSFHLPPSKGVDIQCLVPFGLILDILNFNEPEIFYAIEISSSPRLRLLLYQTLDIVGTLTIGRNTFPRRTLLPSATPLLTLHTCANYKIKILASMNGGII